MPSKKIRKDENIHILRQTLLDNAGYLLERRSDAIKNKRWLEAYLLTFFRIELGLTLLLDKKMSTTEYSYDFFTKITSGKLRLAELIDIFCVLF
ncbi:hypothetical protein ACFL0A_01780, partial [Patescibacteria group bacterium]